MFRWKREVETRLMALQMELAALTRRMEESEAVIDALTERINEMHSAANALTRRVDEMEAERAEAAEMAEKAERAFTEGVANILNYDTGGRK